MKILLIEDDEDLGEIVKYNLEKEGFRVRWLHDGSLAIKEMESVVYDLVILDIMLPKVDGVEICRLMRKSERLKDIPVIMLTALSDEVTKIKSFNYGADDYITKPFSMKELIARIKAISRRLGKRVSRVIECGDLKLDRATKLMFVDGEPVHLTKTEYQLIEFFLENQDKVFSREEVIENIWGVERDETSRTLDVYISRLRKKLKDKGKFLKTIPKFGYIFSLR